MKKGELKGGKVATPIREMLLSRLYNGVMFCCENAGAVEKVRMAALMLKKRNGYSYHTTKRGNNLVVYKGKDTDEPRWIFAEEYYDSETHSNERNQNPN